ncbi:tRNA dihydrouridine synthase [Phycisphaerales bacterium AB-hyl4]|uniref:tRNA-dihydrouridine synthase n=1 Tax=Natronomicrosphaera hydrolytica TaxID=3242702 RepID=A0ABV4U2J4_9BACT
MPTIGNVQLDAPFFQAGLAGYSDAAMRLVARRHGCPYCVTEAMLDQFLIAGGKGLAAAQLNNADHPIAGQLMGSHPTEIAMGAKILVQLGYDVIDINLACPVKKIKKKARGGHLMQVPDEAIAILDAVRQAVGDDRPCTVKLRRGSDDSVEAERHFHRIFEAVIELGYAGAIVHGRTVEQKYLGPSRWAFLRDLVQRYKPEGGDAPLLIGGSGDIWSAADIFRMIDETGVDLVSVARGCIGNPWIFEQARALQRGDAEGGRRSPTLAQQRGVLREHFELSLSLHGEKKAGMMMRKFGIKFSRHHPDGEAVRQAFITVKSLADWEAVLARHYAGDGPGVDVALARPDEAEHASCNEPLGAT